VLPRDIDVLPVQLPGREARLDEPAFARLEPLMDALFAAIRPLLDRPYALFGHSMGGLIAFELARAIRAAALPQPSHLFISARQAPHAPPRWPLPHTLQDAELSDLLRRLGGTPEQVLVDPALRELVFPALRKDFELVDTYAYRPGPPLEVPLRAFGATGDILVNAAALENWRAHTRHFLGVQMFPGHHHYFAAEPAPLLTTLLQDLGLRAAERVPGGSV